MVIKFNMELKRTYFKAQMKEDVKSFMNVSDQFIVVDEFFFFITLLMQQGANDSTCKCVCKKTKNKTPCIWFSSGVERVWSVSSHKASSITLLASVFWPGASGGNFSRCELMCRLWSLPQQDWTQWMNHSLLQDEEISSKLSFSRVDCGQLLRKMLQYTT